MTTQFFPSLAHVVDEFQGCLLDAFGVFWGGNDIGPLAGAKEAMQKLVESGKVVGILSNSSVLARKECEKFAKFGFIEGKHFHFMVTSGEVSRLLVTKGQLPFSTPNKRFWVLGAGHPRGAPHKDIFHETEFLETGHPEDADFIYIGIPHIEGEDQTEVTPFEKQIKTLETKHLPMMCTNPDRFVQEGNPPKIVVRQGSIAALYEAIGGQVHYIGKPYETVYTYAFEEFQKRGIFDRTQILMCGDMPETDIRGARSVGIRSALITETGIMSERIRLLGKEKAIRNIPESDFPDFFIGKLANDF